MVDHGDAVVSLIGFLAGRYQTKTVYEVREVQHECGALRRERLAGPRTRPQGPRIDPGGTTSPSGPTFSPPTWDNLG